jgi:YfiH family protein
VLFTTRRGGFSAAPYDSLNLGRSTGDDAATVARNQSHLLGALGVASPATMGQVHGADLLEVASGGPAGQGDVLATERPDVALAVSTADCLGVVVWNDGGTALAAAHAGWRGVLAGAVDAATAWVAARTASPAHIRAAIGPGIRACCFEVGEEVAERFPADCITPDTPRLRLDLARAAKQRLADCGVTAERIVDLEMCTVCDAERFFSHRRDRGRTGRLWTLSRLHPGRVG